MRSSDRLLLATKTSDTSSFAHRVGEYVIVDSADIYAEPIEWRKDLEAKNRDFGKLSARYVTGHAGR
jgi:hypothetical protein